ncbi:MAG: DUF4316 domain-containing protein [Oscillospiraceae bacterium]|nr:DUF4316 domain-containing protein [Oscillospiraceae bacterium]
MPVQEEEKKQTAGEPDEIHRSESILPVISAVYDNYGDTIKNLQKNKADIHDKISADKEKINVLSETADRLEATNDMLKQLMKEHRIPKAANKIIALNESKINRIKEKQIPKIEKNISKSEKRADKLDKRIETVSLKAEKLKHLSGVIKSFTILSPARRREQFVLHMDGMRNCSNKLLENRISDETEKLSNLRERYEKTDSAVEKYKLTDKIAKQSNILNNLKEKLIDNSNDFSNISSQQLDKVITKTENSVENIIESDTDVETISETVLNDGKEYLRNAEMAMEDDYNMIDGIINNGNKEEKEEPTALFTLKIFDEERYYKCDSLTANEMLHIAANSENPIAEMMKYGEKIDELQYAEIHQSDRFKFSVDFDFNDKSAQLFAVNNGKGGISENNRNENNIISKSVMLSAFIDKVQEHKPSAKVINPDVYKNIPKDNRIINNFPKNIALRVIDELESKNIPYSAIEKNNDNISVTVSKDNEPVFKSAVNSAKEEHTQFANLEIQKQSISKKEKSKAPQKATLSRKQMHEQADALKREQNSESKQKSKNMEH